MALGVKASGMLARPLLLSHTPAQQTFLKWHNFAKDLKTTLEVFHMIVYEQNLASAPSRGPSLSPLTGLNPSTDFTFASLPSGSLV